MKSNTLLAIVLFLLTIGIGIFFFRSNLEPERSSKPQVAVTIFPLYDLVKNIAGSAVEVNLILKPGASPHTFEPTPQLIKKTQEAEKVFAIGHGLDDWVFDLVSERLIIDVVDYGIELLQTTEPAIEENTEEERGPIDPHYWLTAQNAILISQTVADSLSQTFPNLAETFRNNLTAYTVTLKELDTKIIQQLSTVQNKQLITFHDAWFYFADAYNLTVAGTFEPTVGREPTPKYLAKLSELIAQTGVKVLYAEPQFSSAGMRAFLSNQNVSIATIDPEGSKNSISYIDLMLQNARVIAQNQ
jgi:ABC-type Zn uptake system ZnuABC Zn-binding protein ZnuA